VPIYEIGSKLAVPAALKGWRAPVSLAIVLAAAASGYFLLRDDLPAAGSREGAARMMSELMSGKGPVGGPFTLVDQSGARRSLADFRGKLVLLYFGFTYCPDVCPTDLMAVGNLVRSLGLAGDQVQPVFVTLDPARDTPEVLRAYVASFHPRFVALSGTENEIRHAATLYKVYFEKVKPPGSNTYLIDHTAYVFLLDREGRFVTLFPPGTPQERMGVMVREHQR
jgi:cytochrome oxidase Cu insertion factor (SCO1/SenC/PrrC family)